MEGLGLEAGVDVRLPVVEEGRWGSVGPEFQFEVKKRL